MLKDLLSLIYPQVCVICPEDLYQGEKFICSKCRYQLPRTGFHQLSDNPVAKHFWGRIPVEGATSYFYFNKGLKVQELIHQVKYRGKKELGVYLGDMFGSELKLSPFAQKIDLVIPVPLHEQKQKKRGFNQSYYIAKGIADALSAKCVPDLIRRSVATDTQTRKSRIKRWENVEDKFVATHSDQLQNKHVLLVDDVVTTGSTLEACARAILEVQGTKVSIATLACTE
ncbi:MAG: ComF family protein [Bacteroidia bacterium]